MSLSHDPAPRVGDGHEEELYDLLKTSAERVDRSTTTEVKSNEDETTAGNVQLYKDPLGREKKNLDAPWGESGPEKGGKQEPFHNSNSVWDGYEATRQGVLSNAFSGFETAAKADKGLIAQNFKTKDYEAHSPLLERATKVAHARTPTLLEQVKRVAGRP